LFLIAPTEVVFGEIPTSTFVFALTNFTEARTDSPRTECLRHRSNVQCAVRKSREYMTLPSLTQC